MKNILEKLFIFWLISIPFIIFHGYEAPKVIYFFAGSFLLFVFWLVRFLYFKKNIKIDKADKFFLVWLFVLTVSSILGVHPFDSIIGGSYRHQGVIFFLALWVCRKTIQILDKTNRKILIKGVAVSVIVEALIVYISYLTGGLYLGKSLGTVGEANAVAGFLAIGSFFILDSFRAYHLLIPLFAVLLEQSRAGLLSISPFLFKIKKSILPVLIVIGIVVYFMFSFEKGTSPFESREVIWRLGLTSISQKPVLGFGAESGETVFNQAFYKSGFPLSGIIIDRAHNLLIDVALWSGIVGLIVFVIWLYQSFLSIKNINYKMAFCAFLIYSLFQPLSIVHWILLFITINI